MPTCKTCRFLAFAVLFASLFASAPARAQSSQETSMGVWPFLLGNVDPMTSSILQRCQQNGIDTIYLHVWSTRGSQQGRLRMRDEVGTWNPSHGPAENQVTVSRFIEQAHQAGIQVIGVVQCFYEQLALPSDIAHRRFMTETLLRYLVHSYKPNGERYYPFDGICLDYVRWFGGSHTSSEVDSFVDAVRAEIGPLPLHAYVIASAYAFDGPNYNASFNSYSSVRSYLIRNHGQDWEQLARRLDVLLPMAYTADGHVYGSNTSQMQAYLRVVAQYAQQAIRNANASCRVAPAIRLWNDSTGTSSRATIEACASGALLGGAEGYSGFRYGTAQNQSSWWSGFAKYAAPGQSQPIARWTTQLQGRELQVDSRLSSSGRYPAAQLQARYDLDGDGSFELGPLPLDTRKLSLPGSGPRIVRLEVSDPSGARDLSARRFDVAGSLRPADQALSLSAGGQASWTYDGGLGYGGRVYLTISTLSGTSPGMLLPDQRVIPINFDGYTYLGLIAPNAPPFVRYVGTTNIVGGAFPSFQLPAGLLPPSLIGRELHSSVLLFRADLSDFEKISNAARVRFVR
jgi:hypothetical protein